MNEAPTTAEVTASLESILITNELNKRQTRPPDYEAENRALLVIAQHMADSPRSTLQRLAEAALEICRAESAESVLSPGRTAIFTGPPSLEHGSRTSVAGRRVTSALAASCSTVTPMQLFKHPERLYPYLLPISPPVTEALLTPFYGRGKSCRHGLGGRHSPDRKFDAEDLRLIESLGRFAAAVYPLQVALDEQEQQSHSLRDINERLLVSSVRQHELTERAERAESALRASEERLVGELSATRHLQSVSALLIEGDSTDTLYERILDAAVAIMHSDGASIQTLDEDHDALRMLAWRGFEPGLRQDFRVR